MCNSIFSQNSTTILPHMLCPKLSSFHLYSWAKGELLHLPIEIILVWGAFEVSVFICDGPIKMVIATKKEVELGGNPI